MSLSTLDLEEILSYVVLVLQLIFCAFLVWRSNTRKTKLLHEPYFITLQFLFLSVFMSCILQSHVKKYGVSIGLMPVERANDMIWLKYTFFFDTQIYALAMVGLLCMSTHRLHNLLTLISKPILAKCVYVLILVPAIGIFPLTYWNAIQNFPPDTWEEWKEQLKKVPENYMDTWNMIVISFDLCCTILTIAFFVYWDRVLKPKSSQTFEPQNRVQTIIQWVPKITLAALVTDVTVLTIQTANYANSRLAGFEGEKITIMHRVGYIIMIGHSISVYLFFHGIRQFALNLTRNTPHPPSKPKLSDSGLEMPKSFPESSFIPPPEIIFDQSSTDDTNVPIDSYLHTRDPYFSHNGSASLGFSRVGFPTDLSFPMDQPTEYSLFNAFASRGPHQSEDPSSSQVGVETRSLEPSFLPSLSKPGSIQ